MRKNKYRARALKAWETRRKNASKSESIVQEKPKTTEFSVSTCSYTIDQVKEQGRLAMTKDGLTFRFIKLNDQWLDFDEEKAGTGTL